MAAGSEDDLICDFAETYHVLDWKSLPVSTAATLAAGLPESSRSKRRITGMRADEDTVLLAMVLDQLRQRNWWSTEDGQKNRNPPEPIAPRFLPRKKPKPQGKIQTFPSGEAFQRRYAMLTGGGGGNG